MNDTDYLLASLRRRKARAARRVKNTRTVRFVSSLPSCDICAEKGISRPAYAEAVLPARGGSWANICADCFGWGCCSLGLAKGQKYKLKEENKNI